MIPRIFWKDRAVVRRQMVVKNDVTFISRNELKEVYTGVPCHLAVKSLARVETKNVSTAVTQDYVLFCSPRYQFKVNDKLTITRPNGDVFNLYVGQIHSYVETCQLSLTFEPVAESVA